MSTPVKDRTTHEMQLAYLVDRQVIGKAEKNTELTSSNRTKHKKVYAEMIKRACQVLIRSNQSHCQRHQRSSDNSIHAPITAIPGTRKAKDILPGFSCDLRTRFLFRLNRLYQKTDNRQDGQRWHNGSRILKIASPRVWLLTAFWQYHFWKQVLVATSNDFGHLGERPQSSSTARLVNNQVRQRGMGVSKKMHRLIMNSATYKTLCHATRIPQQAP